MKSKKIALLLSLSLLMIGTLSGCGSSGSTASSASSSGNDTNIIQGPTTGAATIPQTSVKASDYVGNWSGNYSTDKIAQQAFGLALQSDQGTGTLPGTFTSSEVTGTVSAVLNADGSLTITVSAGGGYSLVLKGILSNGTFGITSITGITTSGASTTGSGSCTAASTSSTGANVDHLWIGYYYDSLHNYTGRFVTSTLSSTSSDAYFTYHTGTITSSTMPTLVGLKLTLAVSKSTSAYTVMMSGTGTDGTTYAGNTGSGNVTYDVTPTGDVHYIYANMATSFNSANVAYPTPLTLYHYDPMSSPVGNPWTWDSTSTANQMGTAVTVSSASATIAESLTYGIYTTNLNVVLKINNNPVTITSAFNLNYNPWGNAPAAFDQSKAVAYVATAPATVTSGTADPAATITAISIPQSTAGTGAPTSTKLGFTLHYLGNTYPIVLGLKH